MNLSVFLFLYSCILYFYDERCKINFPVQDNKVVLYCIVLYCIVLYCIVLYCIVLYCIVLYCIVNVLYFAQCLYKSCYTFLDQPVYGNDMVSPSALIVISI